MTRAAAPASARLSEREARTLLFVRAVEETDHGGELLTPESRASATRRAFEVAGGPADPIDRSSERARATEDADLVVLLNRAAILRDEVLRRSPALVRVTDPSPAFRRTLPFVIVAAILFGAATNFLGPARHISILAFPLAGIVLWNLLLYLSLFAMPVARWASRRRGGAAAAGHPASVGTWLKGLRLSLLTGRFRRSARHRAAAEAVERFGRSWIVAAAPLFAARARVALHLGALSLALGAIVGMYASGIAFEYRAQWESTWLEAGAVQSYVDVVLAPAARLLGVGIPDVAPLRGPAGEGSAAPWIHLWATTLALFVVVPRAVLAGIEAGRAARRRGRLEVDLDAAYYWRALAGVRGTAVAVEIVTYSCDPDVGLRERLRKLLQELEGARAAIRDGGSLAYGDGPESLRWDGIERASLLVVLVFPLAQTPEAEVHGEFLARLQERAAEGGARLLVVLETASYARRLGSTERLRERRAAWDRFLRDYRLAAVALDEAGKIEEDDVDRWVEQARRRIWPASAD